MILQGQTAFPNTFCNLWELTWELEITNTVILADLENRPQKSSLVHTDTRAYEQEVHAASSFIGYLHFPPRFKWAFYVDVGYFPKSSGQVETSLGCLPVYCRYLPTQAPVLPRRSRLLCVVTKSADVRIFQVSCIVYVRSFGAVKLNSKG